MCRKYDNQSQNKEMESGDKKAKENGKEFVYDENQKPEWKSLMAEDEFCKQFLESSKDSYPRTKNPIEHLKSQIENKANISEDMKIENFLNDLPKTARNGQPIKTYHNGYLKYLLTAWRNDCGIEVGPWHIWNIVLHQLCHIVKKDPESFRDVFTTSKEKVKITFTDGQMFDIDRFIGQLRNYVPVNIDTFVPQFPGQPPMYRESMYGLFADMVQEFYSCGILSCSIPKVRLLGSPEDWLELVETIRKVNTFFEAKVGKLPYLTKATKKVFEMVTHLHDAEYWKKFFSVKRCGSGGEQEVIGHVVALIDFDSIIKTECLPEMISRFPFEYIGKDMNFVSGIFYSYVDDQNILVPEYHCNILWKNLDRCKCTDSDVETLKKLLDFTQRMKKYDDDYNGYSKNHLAHKHVSDSPLWFYHSDNLRRCAPIEIPLFKKHVGQNYYDDDRKTTDEERLAEYKKSYEKNVAEIIHHNEIVKEVRAFMNKNNMIDEPLQNNGNNGKEMTTSQKLYVKFANEHRAHFVKQQRTEKYGKHCFWLREYSNLENSGYGGLYSRDFPHIDLEEFKQLLASQAEDVELITKNFDAIYDYIANNEFGFFKDGLLRMYNIDIISMFVKKFAEKPFIFNWRGGSYSCMDANLPNSEYGKVYEDNRKGKPIEMTEELKNELVNNLCFYICSEFLHQSQFSEEARTFMLKGFLSKFSSEEFMFSIYKYSLSSRVESAIKSYEGNKKSDAKENAAKAEAARFAKESGAAETDDYVKSDHAKYYLPEKSLKPEYGIKSDILCWKKFTKLTGNDLKEHCDYIGLINNKLEELHSDFRVTEEFYSDLNGVEMR